MKRLNTSHLPKTFSFPLLSLTGPDLSCRNNPVMTRGKDILSVSSSSVTSISISSQVAVAGVFPYTSLNEKRKVISRKTRKGVRICRRYCIEQQDRDSFLSWAGSGGKHVAQHILSKHSQGVTEGSLYLSFWRAGSPSGSSLRRSSGFLR